MPPVLLSPWLTFVSLRSLLITFFLGSSLLNAQTTSSSSHQKPRCSNFELPPFALVDDPNNEADAETGFGAVANNFQIGTLPITAAQYTVFLNAISPIVNRYGFYDQRMTSDPDVACITYNQNNIQHYTVIPGREDFPITYIDLFCAVRFCNWISHGCPVLDLSALTPDAINAITETGAYTIHDDHLSQETRTLWIEKMPNAPVWIPTEDQWYKAAYYHHDTGKIITYDPDDPIPLVQNQGSWKYWNYPTQSMTGPSNRPFNYYLNVSYINTAANYYDNRVFEPWISNYTTDTWSYWHCCYIHDGAYLTPVGTFSNSPGPYGTFDMAGNVNEWIFSEDAGAHPDQPLCPIRGGSWQSPSTDLHRQTRHLVGAPTKHSTIGFRIACQTSPAGALSNSYDLTSAIIKNATEMEKSGLEGGKMGLLMSVQPVIEAACGMEPLYEKCASWLQSCFGLLFSWSCIKVLECVVYKLIEMPFDFFCDVIKVLSKSLFMVGAKLLSSASMTYWQYPG